MHYSQPQAQLTTANEQIAQLLAQLTTANEQVAEDADFQEEVIAFMRASNLYLKLLLGLMEREERLTRFRRDLRNAKDTQAALAEVRHRQETETIPAEASCSTAD